MRKAILALAAAGVAVTAATTTAIAGRSAATAVSPLCRTAGIGFAGPLTGGGAFLGQDQLHWVQVFLSYWNTGKAIPGTPAALKRIKLRIAVAGDSALDPQKSATVAAQIRSNRSILAVVGFAGSNENLGGGPVLDRAGIVYVTPSATRDELTTQLKNFFRIVPNNTRQATVGVAYIFDKLGLKSGDSAMVVDDAEAYGIGIADAAQRLMQGRGVKVGRESQEQQKGDYSALAQKAVAQNVKLVYAPTQVAADSQLFADQLKGAGFKGIFFGTDGSFDAKSFHFPGAYISFFGPDVYQLAIAKPYVAAFTKRFGQTTPFGAPSFVAAQVLAVAISRSCADGKTSRAEVRRLVASVSLPTTMLGHAVAFDNRGDVRKGPARGVTVFQIQPDGKYKLVFSA